MYELLHEIPSDILQVNQHETEKTRVAHIEDFSADDFYSADGEQHYKMQESYSVHMHMELSV